MLTFSKTSDLQFTGRSGNARKSNTFMVNVTFGDCLTFTVAWKAISPLLIEVDNFLFYIFLLMRVFSLHL